MDEELGLAAAAAALGGDLLARDFGRARLASATLRDVKLDQDLQSQALIVRHLTLHSPYPVLTEESGWLGATPDADAPYWVVDPLDGSFNYLYGIPLCCVAVALCRGMTPLAGCVLDFLRGESLTGGPGLPLRRNGQVLEARPAGSGILATGVPSGGDPRGTALGAALQHWRKLRLLGSAALSLAWVARGRMDAYHEDGIRWWDVAAGLALVGAAGGSFQLRRSHWTNIAAPTRQPAGTTALPRPEDPLHVSAWAAGVAQQE